MDEPIPYLDHLRSELVRSVARGDRPSRWGSLRVPAFTVLIIAVVAVPAFAVVQRTFFAPDQRQLNAERGGIFDPESFRVVRTVEDPAGVTWTVVTYRTSKYSCLDVYGGITGAEQPSGAVGECGFPSAAPEGLSGIGEGGLDVGGRFYNVVNGRVGLDVARVEATLSDGTTRIDTPRGNVTLFVTPADVKVVRLRAFDANGQVIATVTVAAS